MDTIEAVEVDIDFKCKTTQKIRATDADGEEWENDGNADAAFLKEVFDKMLEQLAAQTPTITLSVEGDFLIQSDTPGSA